MRIGLVLEQFDPRRGGLECWTARFAEQLIRRGHEVHVVARQFHLPPATSLDSPMFALLDATTDGLLLSVSAGGRSLRADHLEVLDPLTGDRRVVLDLPDGADFMLTRGGSML